MSGLPERLSDRAVHALTTHKGDFASTLAFEVAASRRAVKALRELHYVQDVPWLRPWCPRCGEDWPCQIAAILDKEGL